ncbi:hypothetical protein Leryth_004224 [Lithospermum erythrorhizon]|nr:hypothetical protein Leryth_004224 [Lithospermum erythrorhizon]
MVEAKVPLPFRDQCAHLLIPLNKCRHAEFFLPWKYAEDSGERGSAESREASTDSSHPQNRQCLIIEDS